MAMGQSATLRGIVLNELNEPLEGVNVVSENQWNYYKYKWVLYFKNTCQYRC